MNTQAEHQQPSVQALQRSRLVTRSMAMLFFATFGALTSFYVMLAVVPQFVVAIGGSRSAAGLVTSFMMGATVIGELATPLLSRLCGTRSMFGIGLLLLGAPAVVLAVWPNSAVVIGVSIARGVGFGVVAVLGSASVARAATGARRGEAVALYGVITGIPAVVALPAGVWIAEHLGFRPVFIAGSVSALVGLAVVGGLPEQPTSAARPTAPKVAASRSSSTPTTMATTATMAMPVMVFLANAVGAGVVVTFLPVAIDNQHGGLVPAGLFVHSITATATRFWAGRRGDRHGHARLMLPAAAISGIGVLALVAAPSAVAVMISMVLFGAGFGVIENASLAVMYERAPVDRYNKVSAMWNATYDAGLGLGAAGFGVVAAHSGFRVAFGATAVVVVAACLPARRDRQSVVAVARDASVVSLSPQPRAA
ncbi:MAG: MFS transporter [Ilumatobacteraceae bacterium]|nr:MFS transporter [Ilumatobacteraceae bacterium]